MLPAIVVMGVAGSGKTTIGAALAERLGAAFVEGDRLHPAANVAKMAAGTPLTDADRWPWLDAVGDEVARLRGEGPVVAACSALKRVYRDRLRDRAGDLLFVFPDVPRELLAKRLQSRRGHFFPASLLDNQLATLEPPGEGEACVRTAAGLGLPATIRELAAKIAQSV